MNLRSNDPEAALVESVFERACAPSQPGMARLVEMRVAESPDAIAVVCGERQWTYCQLNDRANRVAGELRRRGVKRGDVVGVFLERSDDWITVIFGILKTGAAYLPLDASLPDARLQMMLSDAAARFVLCRQDQLERLSIGVISSAMSLVDVADCLSGLRSTDCEQIPSESHPDDLAYVMFTSGSTGRPKGVMIQQRSIIRHVFENDYVRFAADRVFGHLCSISFDVSTLEIWGALLQGAKLVVVTNEHLDFSALESLLKRNGVTTLFITPALYNEIIDAHPAAFTALEQIVVGGDALSVARMVEAYERLGSRVELINGYGPTECTVFCTAYRIPRTISRQWTNVPIGKALAATTAYVLDEQRHPVPPGVIGELYIGGCGLAVGYINQPERTAERFVPDPFSADPTERLYRTGDAVRQREDGNIEYVQRLDNQIKLRGYRIELGEIESAMRSHPQVLQAAVLLREDQPGEKRLVAYFTTVTEGAEQSHQLDRKTADSRDPRMLTSSVFRTLRQQLPSYMLPSCLIPVADWPLNTNGKLDRARLPLPDEAAYRPQHDFVAPRSDLEHYLAMRFAELLGMERVSIEDSFFELGGHSLLATRLKNRILREYGIELPMRVIFAQPTIAKLAEQLEQRQQSVTTTDSSASPGGLVSRPLATDGQRVPLSFAQQRLWFLDQYEGTLAAYNLSYAWRLQGELDWQALRQAFELVVERHPQLRIRIDSSGGTPYQFVPAEIAVHLIYEDGPFAGMEELGETGLREILEDEIARPISLSREPPVRGRLLRLGTHDHLLLITIHHIVSDGWSQPILWHDLQQAYTAIRSGLTPSWSPLPLQYRDYVHWQRTSLTPESLQPLVEYWRARLAGLQPLDLPTDYSRPDRMRYEGGCHRFTIDVTRVKRLSAIARQQQVTLNMLLLSVFQTLLHRYTGQTDIAVALPTAGRMHEELEALVGFFVNTLVVRVDVAGEPTMAQLLERVSRAVLEALDHQQLPFEKLVEALQPERALNRTPYTSVSFQFMDFDLHHLELPGLSIQEILPERAPARFELEMNLRMRGEEIKGEIVYRSDLFSRQRIARMAAHFSTLLEAIVDRVDESINQLPLLTNAERKQILEDWNNTTRPYPDRQTLPQLVEAHALQTPDRSAVVCGDRCWTYRELNEEANVVAHALARLGVARGDIVGVCLERSAEWIQAILGILKCGAAYLPLDPNLPETRLKRMLADTGARVVVGERDPSSNLLPTLQSSQLDFVKLNDCLASQVSADRENLATAIAPDDLAYVMFTSGSTGRPKGVTIRHRSIVRLVFANDYVTFGADRVFAHLSSISFDAATWEIWGALLHGSKLVIGRTEQLDFQQLENLLRQHNVTTLFLTTTLFNEVIDSRPQTLATVREVMTGGESLSVAHIVAAYEQLGTKLQIVNGYGPTESTVCITGYRIPHSIGLDWPSVPIGKPLANTTVYVLDAHQQPVPVGIAGELYMGGPGRSSGYAGQPERTAELFVANPLSMSVHYASHLRPAANGDDKLYRTGDLVRWRDDGNLEFVGRRDEQIKLRGQRIELPEIELALEHHPRVEQAVVVVREAAPGDKRLVAYYQLERTPSAARELSTAELAAHLRRSLPAYMIPTHFVACEEWPRTASGKLDRGRLPAPTWDQLTGEQLVDSVHPTTDLEAELATLFADLLGCDQVSTADSFFDLGGHSLLAVRLQSRIGVALFPHLSLRDIFECPTVRQLAQRIQDLRRRQSLPEPPSLMSPDRQPLPDDGPLPLSLAQQRLWFLDQLEGPSAAYNVSHGWRLRGPLDVAALQQAISLLEMRHAMLRASIQTREGAPVLLVRDKPAIRVMVERWEDVNSPLAADGKLIELVEAEWARVFDLSRDPPLRLRLLQLGTSDYLLTMTWHHLATDGWSLALFGRELNSVYSSLLQGEPPNLSKLSLTYADFARWQRELMTPERLEPLFTYWRKQLSGIETLNLPTDYVRPIRVTHRGRCFRFQIDSDRCERLHRLAKQQQVTMNMLLLAIFQTLLYRYTDQCDVAVAVPVDGRQHHDFDPVVGFFVNTLVVRSDLSNEPTMAELLGRVRQTLLDALDHQALPFSRLVEELQPERTLNRNPLAQVSFQWIGYEPNNLQLQQLEIEELLPLETPVRFDLELSLWQRRADIQGEIYYSSDLFSSQRIARMAGHLRTLIDAVLDDVHQRIVQLSLLTEQEQTQLIEFENDCEEKLGPEPLLHQSVEAAAQATPSAIALVCQDRRWSYAQLNARANQLAHALRQRGVRRGDIVGVCMARSDDFVIAILGVLKSGAAYLPLDSSLPKSRWQFMLEDTRARCILVATDDDQRTLLQSADDINQVSSLGRDCQVLSLAQCWAESPVSARQNATTVNEPDDLAYVMFTSGSTGRPKGVAIRHRSVRSLVADRDYITFGRDRVFAHVSSVVFDASTWEIWGALLHGSKLVIGQSEQLDFPRLAELLTHERVTTMILTTSVFHEVVDLYPQLLAGIDELLVGGEALSVPHMVAAYQKLPSSLKIVNAYGPTESTVCVTTYRVPRDIDLNWSSVPIGKPLTHSSIYVLDRERRPVPIGVVGELYIGGTGLATGYMRQPELTAEKFVEVEFGHGQPRRLYRSGDLVRWRDDGNLEFVGRIDSQIKLRGQRIELAEIERALLADSRVSQAVAMVREDRPGDRRLVGYYVAAGNQELEAVTLIESLKERLPRYMVPTALVQLGDLPLNSSGKIDRSALPVPLDMNPVLVDRRTAPTSAVESQLVEIWQHVLGVERIGIHDDFFDLGGHSLLAVRLFALIERRMGCRLPIALLFEHSTIASLAPHCESTQPPVNPGESSLGSLIELRSAGMDPPLILMPSLGGELIFAKQLIESLGDSIRVLGLQPNLTLSNLEIFRGFSLAAKKFAEIIRHAQPYGPYYLVGYSYGGWLAVEVARELKQAGAELAFVGLIDTGFESDPLPSKLLNKARTLAQAIRSFPQWYNEERRGQTHGQVVRGIASKLSQRARTLVTNERSSITNVDYLSPARVPRQHQELMQVVYDAILQHRPRHYAGEITLFRAAVRPLGHVVTDDLGWRNLADAVDVYEVPGNHETILKAPHVEVLGRLIREVLNRKHGQRDEAS